MSAWKPCALWRARCRSICLTTSTAPQSGQRATPARPTTRETAAAAIREMVRQTGPMVLEDGLLKRGTLIRHLILPGGLQEAKAVMDWVAASFPAGTAGFSLMSQYIPWGRAGEYPEINRPLRRSEARAAQAYMAALGLEGFTQEAGAAEADYIPPFDLSGVEKG